MIAGQVGLVTVTYNSAPVLGDFLQSVDAVTARRPSTCLYVVDNDSRDASVAMVRGRGLPANIIRNPDNRGVATANNQGIEAALTDGCEFVLLINNDTVFPETLVDDLVRHCQGWDALTPLILAEEPPGSVWFAGGKVLSWRGFGVAHVDLGSDGALARRGSDAEVVEIRYAPTCCLLVRASTFDRIGRMDEDFFVYSDDVDFCLRLTRSGLKLGYDSSVAMLHKASSLTGGPTSAFGLRHDGRNRVLLMRKHGTRLQRSVGTAYLHVWAAGRVPFRGESLSMMVTRFRAFAEGRRLPLSASATHSTSRSRGAPPSSASPPPSGQVR